MPITARGVQVADKQKRLILQGIDLTIPDHAVTLIVGRNGAGKSTLLEALSGLVRLDSGTIRYGELPLWREDKGLNAEVIRRIGNVFQYPEQQLFASSVEREFAYSLRFLKLSDEEESQRISGAMSLMRLPPELSEESPHLLSGGQKRRVALASTMATHPDWLLLDEPTAGLDAQGVSALLEFVLDQRQSGRGIVIATHDLEVLLPYADHVIVLQGGAVFAELSRKQLMRPGAASLFTEAGLRAPTALLLADKLRLAGIRLSEPCPSPHEAAAAVAQAAAAGGFTQPAAEQEAVAVADKPVKQSRQHADQDGNEGAAQAVSQAAFLQRLDPRAKWIFYTLLSIGILIQSSWEGFFVGGAAAVAVIWYARVSWRPLLKVSIPLLSFIIVSMLVSGVEFDGGIRLEMTSSLRTLFELLKILIISMLGVTLASVTSQLMMKRAIEQSLRFLRPLRLPVDAVALGGSLMLRFIPVFMQEYRRFSKIVKARGKEQVKSEGIRLRQMPVLFIPLIVSLFQTASDLTTAMQARGLTGFHKPRSSRVRLVLNGSDWTVLILGILVFAGFIGLELLFG